MPSRWNFTSLWIWAVWVQSGLYLPHLPQMVAGWAAQYPRAGVVWIIPLIASGLLLSSAWIGRLWHGTTKPVRLSHHTAETVWAILVTAAALGLNARWLNPQLVLGTPVAMDVRWLAAALTLGVADRSLTRTGVRPYLAWAGPLLAGGAGVTLWLCFVAVPWLVMVAAITLTALSLAKLPIRPAR